MSIRTEDFAPAAPATSKLTARRVSPLSMHQGDEDDIATPAPRAQPILAPDATGNLRVTAKGNDMPKGQYDRSKSKPRKPKKSAEPAKDAPIVDKKPSRRKTRAAPAPSAGRFGVYNDGTVHVDLPSCKGTMSADHARELVAFITRLRGK